MRKNNCILFSEVMSPMSSETILAEEMKFNKNHLILNERKMTEKLSS
jgi:hypothetical protein